MKIASWNVGGLRRLVKKSKFKDWCAGFDIFLLQETMLHERSRPVSIPGFTLFHKFGVLGPRGRPKGGLCIGISHDVAKIFEINNVSVIFSESEAMLIQLTRKCSSSLWPPALFVLNLYVPSPPRQVSFPNLGLEIQEAVGDRVGNHPFLVAGDFNAHYTRSARAVLRDRCFSWFFDDLCDEGFVPFPDRGSSVPSFVSSRGASLIDLTLSRGFDLNTAGSSLFAYEGTGHRAVQIECMFPPLRSNVLMPRTSYRKHLSVPPSPNFFGSLTRLYGWSGPLEILAPGVSLVFTMLITMLGSFLHQVRPPEKSSESWFRYLSFSEIRELDRLERAVVAFSGDIRVGTDTTLLCEAKKEWTAKTLKLKGRAAARLAASVEDAKGDHTRLWKVIRNFRLDPDASQGLPVDTLCEHFVSLFNRGSDGISLPFLHSFAPFNEALDRRFTMVELESALGALKANSAPGQSGIGNDVILELADVKGFKRLLLNLFNGCLEGGSIPQAWSHCEMFFLYKGKGDPLLPSSYRAIALLDSFVKLYERLLCHRLQEWVTEQDIIPPSQFGFRAASGTLDAIFVFWKLILHFVHLHKGTLFVALIDFKSAFPSVDRNLLFARLAALGLSRKFSLALHSLFEKNSFQLRLGGEVSASFPVTTGLREGSVLSPLLFSIFISDLEREVLAPFPSSSFLTRDCIFQGVTVNGLLFADDLVIFSRSEAGLKMRLKLLKSYVDSRKLTVNTAKCEIVSFGSPPGANFSFKFGGQEIPVVRRCKYLGVLFDQVHILKGHEEHLVARFQNAVGGFFRLARHLDLSDLPTWSRLQSSLLFSVFYGSEFLPGEDLAARVTPIYHKALRSYIGLPPCVSNAALNLIFPEFSFRFLFLKKKCGFLRRTTQVTPTLAAAFFMEDRVVSFPEGRGFSAELQQDLAREKLGELVGTLDKGLVNFALSNFQEEIANRNWGEMVGAKSTRFLCTVFGDQGSWQRFLAAAAARNLSALRIVLLTWTGSLGVAVTKGKVHSCPCCRQRLDARHYFLCGQESGFQLVLTALARRLCPSSILQFTFLIYFKFLFRFRPTILHDEEVLLFEFANMRPNQ